MFNRRKNIPVINWLNKDLRKRINEKINEVLKLIDKRIEEANKEITKYANLYTENFQESIERYKNDRMYYKYPFAKYNKEMAQLDQLNNVRILNVMVKEYLMNFKDDIEKIMTDDE